VDGRVGVVMITGHRRVEALRSVGRLLVLAERPRVVVIDNGSSEALALTVPRNRTPRRAFGDAQPGGRWVLAERPAVEARLASLDGPQRRSAGGRYGG
jgi:hypothetical protein